MIKRFFLFVLLLALFILSFPLLMFIFFDIDELGLIVMVFFGTGVSFAYELFCRAKGFNRWTMAKQSRRDITSLIVQAFYISWMAGTIWLIPNKINEFTSRRFTNIIIIDNTQLFGVINCIFLIILMILVILLPTKDFKEKEGWFTKPKKEDHYWDGDESKS